MADMHDFGITLQNKISTDKIKSILDSQQGLLSLGAMKVPEAYNITLVN